MPYIKEARRTVLLAHVTDETVDPETVGELNYYITAALSVYMQNRGLSYQTINDILGALEGAKMEFYRRVASKYEDQKIIDNGDVY